MIPCTRLQCLECRAGPSPIRQEMPLLGEYRMDLFSSPHCPGASLLHQVRIRDAVLGGRYCFGRSVPLQWGEKEEAVEEQKDAGL